jgi:hypothetical protein
MGERDVSDCSPAVVYGSGRHIETISADEMVEFVKVPTQIPPASPRLFRYPRRQNLQRKENMAETLQVGIAITQLYSLTHFFLKLSILQQYARISVLPSGKRLCHNPTIIVPSRLDWTG